MTPAIRTPIDQSPLRMVTVAIGISIVFATFVSSQLVAQQIFIREQVTLDRSIIRLQDIADVVGGSLAEKSDLQSLELFPASSAHHTISSQDIAEALAASGVNLLHWRLAGSSRVEILAGPTSQPRSLRHRANEAYANPNSLSTKSPRLLPAQQKTRINHTELSAPVSFQDNRLTPQNSATASSNNTIQGWALKQDLERGQIIGPQDLVPVSVSENRVNHLQGDSTQIVGMSLRQSLKSGQAITTPMLEVAKYVFRGKEVKLISRVGEIEVSTVARCQSDAGLGQIVAVESLDRQRRYIGQVIDFAVVRIVDPSLVANESTATQLPPQATHNAAQNRRLPSNTLR